MDSSFDVSDTSDWLQTSLSQLGPVEQALRCQVCKDFFDTPMITSCSHTFCSLCIRRCLTTDGRCPACRTQDQAMKLRLNSTVQELVDAFKAARPAILLFVQNVEAAKGGIVEVKKRKIDDTDMEEDKDEHEEDMDHSLRRRKVKSRRRRRSISDGGEHDLFAYDGTNAGSQPGRSARDLLLQVIVLILCPDDGLTACPICGARMKEESVYPHLDVHSNSASTKSPARYALQWYRLTSRLTQLRQTPSHLNVTANSRSSKAMERLPQLNYFLLKDDALRKKLSELGIPNVGPKDLLIRRHTEWVNLVNANCDSSKPKMKRELLHELEAWDRTQGRQIMSNCNGAGTSSSVMSKDFDGAAWATNHGNNFQTLIAQARRKVNPKVEHTSSTNETPDPVLDQRIDNEHLATSPNRNPAESIDQLHAIQSPGNLADLDVGD